MSLGVPAGELVGLALAIVAAGVVTGLLAGLFGIGGGGIIVPVLYEVFRALDVPDSVRMQLCVGTSLAIILPTTIRSYRAHRARGAVQMDVLRAWTWPAVIGVGGGAVVAAFAPGGVFKIAFAVIACIIAFKLLFGRDSWRIADSLPKGGPLMWAYGVFIGLSSSLMGVSGGSVSNMIQTLHGTPIHNSVATSAGLGVPITIAGTIGFMLAGLPQQSLMPPLSIGFVSLIGFALMAPVSSFMAPYGARLAHSLPRRKLEVGFGLFLVAVSVRLLASIFYG
jgi:uncharacterized membrane protein YfcA